MLTIISLMFCMGANAPQKSGVIIKLVDGDVTVVYVDSKIAHTNHLVAQEIFTRKINAPYHEKIQMVMQKLEQGYNFRTALLYCFPYLENAVTNFLHKTYVEAKDAQISFYPDSEEMFEILPEQNGHKINEARLYKDIYYALCREKNVTIFGKRITIFPAIKKEQLKNQTFLRAKYSTDFSSSTSARKNNIMLAMSKINGTVLNNGESFSFNKTVGARTKENGFLQAKIIVGGKYEDGFGGGVCQASTTMYNAALLSGLTITEVKSHSLKVGYELASFDAMVNSASSDLKFVNESGGRIFIKAYCTQSNVCVEIYGQALLYTIKRRSKIIEEGDLPGYEEMIDIDNKYFDQDTPSGSKKIISYPHASLKSEGYLDYYLGGILFKSVKIRQDKYSQICGIIAVMP